MADQKQQQGQQKPKSQGSFWTVAETFTSHFAESGAGFVQSFFVRGCATILIGIPSVFLLACSISWYLNADMPEILFDLWLPTFLILLVGVAVFVAAGRIRDIEPLQEWAQDLRDERARPAMPQTVIVNHAPPGITVNDPEESADYIEDMREEEA